MQSPRKKAIRPQLAIVAVGQIGPSGGKSGNDGNEVTCNDDWSLGSVRIGREDDACEGVVWTDFLVDGQFILYFTFLSFSNLFL